MSRVRKKTIATVIACIILLLAIGLPVRGWYHDHRERLQREGMARYGYDGLIWDSPDQADPVTGNYCRTVFSAIARWHVNIWGEYWQEPPLRWEDIQILSPAPRELVHGLRGEIAKGDRVCGWSDSGAWVTIYRPTGEVMNCSTFDPEPPEICGGERY